MPSISDSLFLFVLALLLFGPKKLPVLARELGKWIGEFRRASNEFKMQMEEELRQSEQAERQKQIAAMEAAAPAPPPMEPEPVHPHLRDVAYTPPAEQDLPAAFPAEPGKFPAPEPPAAPLPIATSGSLNLMPPSTGLPVPRSRSQAAAAADNPLGGLLDAIPAAAPENGSQPPDTSAEVEETAAHGR